MTPCKPGLRSTQHLNARYTCVLTPCKLGLRSTQYLNSSSTSSPFQVTLGRTQRCISPQHEPRPLQPVNHELKQVSAPHVVQLSTWVCAACPSEGPLSSDGKQGLTLRPPCARGCEASESSSGSCQLPDHCNLSLHSSVLLNHALALILSLSASLPQGVSLLPSLKVFLCLFDSLSPHLSLCPSVLSPAGCVRSEERKSFNGRFWCNGTEGKRPANGWPFSGALSSMGCAVQNDVGSGGEHMLYKCHILQNVSGHPSLYLDIVYIRPPSIPAQLNSPLSLEGMRLVHRFYPKRLTVHLSEERETTI